MLKIDHFPLSFYITKKYSSPLPQKNEMHAAPSTTCIRNSNAPIKREGPEEEGGGRRRKKKKPALTFFFRMENAAGFSKRVFLAKQCQVWLLTFGQVRFGSLPART